MNESSGELQRRDGAEDVLIILPVRNLVLFPQAVTPVSVGRERSLKGAQEAVRTGRKVGFLLQKDPATDEPTPDDLHRVGTVASVLRLVTAPDGRQHVIAQGEQRFRVLDFQPGFPFYVARVEYISEPSSVTAEIEARALDLKRLAEEALELLPQVPAEIGAAIRAMESPGALADALAGVMDVTAAEKQRVLATESLELRLERVSELLAHRVEVLRLQRKIQENAREALDERQKEYVLREQLKQIRKELGEDEDGTEGFEELERELEAAGMPEDVLKQARKELGRLERMPDQSTEYSMLRTWLDTLVALPWNKLDEEAIDLARAREVLDADHFGLDKIKRRIVEYLAVRKLNPAGRSPILCFVGPPGVGKTSLGQSIARATGLAFQRVSLGGVHDESEIRGHRRTYVASMPGNVINAVKKAGTRNPVIMLDEIDKLGQGFQGDPAAALLEVLDPEQNSTFRDHYLGVDFDLSKVLFIATANVLDTIPGPLRDRMEIIELTGYTEDEKVEIAKRYLLARQRKANGLGADEAQISDEALRAVVRGYTREAGCRQLERELGAVLRSAAVQVAEGRPAPDELGLEDIERALGAPRFDNEVAARVSVPGVATGLAWTPVGGDILFIEATRVPGNGKLILTGQLGDVMKESAQAALSLLKARAGQLGFDPGMFEKSDVHVHVPAGAIPKDGPSAGVALYTALVSLFSGRTVAADVAMTGEISLRGLVLPVGGIKEKVVAAARAGIRKVVLPKRNRKDLEDIPASVQRDVEFVWAERVDDVIEVALGAVGFVAASSHGDYAASADDVAAAEGLA